MQSKVEKIFDFLQANRKYNRRLQRLYFAQALLPYSNTEDKVLSLLSQILNTQSQPKLEYVKEFFQNMQGNKRHLKSYKGLIKSLSNSKNISPTFANLFKLLREQPGWGNKTSALFVKTVYKLHLNPNDPLAFFSDVPKLSTFDFLMLPVDAVIENIFKFIDPNKSWNFTSINKYLSKIYRGNEMEVWDDLWFWGFISQKGNKDRVMQYNEAKYWVQLHTDKNPKMVAEVKNKVDEFISLLN